MRFKYRIKEGLQYLAFAFYPKTTLIACAVFFAIVITILGIVMEATSQGSNLYNIVFALTTGAAGSFFVSFVVELAGNYRHNKLAWYELQEYYTVVWDYEMYKQIMMQSPLNQQAVKNACQELATAGDAEEIEVEDEPNDIIQITWMKIPDMIPVFKQTLKDKKEFLSDEEIDELNMILSEYHLIQCIIAGYILNPSMKYDVLHHSDKYFLKKIYPSNMIKNMPKWIRKELSQKESLKAYETYVEEILSDASLLSQIMEKYDISQNSIDRYPDEMDRMEEDREPEDIDFNEIEFYKQEQLEHNSFVSWCLSNYCKNISESVDILKKNIQKKPYYGMLLEIYNKSAR